MSLLDITQRQPFSRYDCTITDPATQVMRRSDRQKHACLAALQVAHFLPHHGGDVGLLGVVADLTRRWSDTRAAHPFQRDLRAAWTMRRTAAVKQFVKNTLAAVVFEAQVQFANTSLDEWVDDGALLVPWWHQFEMVVGIDEPDTLPVLRKAAVVYYKHQEYGYEQRGKLIAHWDQLN